MPFHPIEALIRLDQQLSPGPISGPIERFHKGHYDNVRRRALALDTPDLTAEIEQLKAGESTRLLISAGMVGELLLTPQAFARDFPVETVFGVLAATPLAILLGPHRGTVKLHEREIMEEELNRRRPPDAIG